MQNQKQPLKLDSCSFRIKQSGLTKKTKKVGHFRIGQQIGKGGFATVYRAVQIHTGVQVAAKVVDLDSISSKDLLNLRRQIKIQEKIRHPHVVRIYETVWTENRAYIFMELVKGKELFEYLKDHGPMDEKRAAKIFYQIVKTVQHLHQLGIAHRDIKTQNILIDSNFNAKLIDFGLAKTFYSIEHDCLTTFCGSPSYTAPQILQKKKYSGQRVDIWCLGVTLYVLLQACLPFDDFDRNLRERNIHNLSWHKAQDSSIQAVKLYESIFTKQKTRITIDQILCSTFFSKQKFSLQLLPQAQQNSIGEVNFKAIQKTCLLLNIEEELAKRQVISQKIGQIFCVYQLCLMKNDNCEDYKSKLSKSQCGRSQPHKSQNITTEPKTQKMIGKKRSQSPVIKILPVVNDSIRATTKDTRGSSVKTNHVLCPDKLKIDLFGKDEVIKSAMRLKGRKYKNIFAPELELNLPKPRLREDSPESPKRLLDCVRRYN